AVDAGADAVIGHHPHVAQGLEVYKKKVIAYSLGNFVFGTRNPNADEGLLLRLTLRPRRPPAVEIFPLSVDNEEVHFQPRLLKGKAAKESLLRLKTLSKPLGAPLRIKTDRALLP
ncbi:MAG: CapA family protein, partial [Elusimicrobia bacterium]|nr:CapA family protein [Elusimicrobiota bacterium]